MGLKFVTGTGTSILTKVKGWTTGPSKFAGVGENEDS